MPAERRARQPLAVRIERLCGTRTGSVLSDANRRVPVGSEIGRSLEDAARAGSRTIAIDYTPMCRLHRPYRSGHRDPKTDRLVPARFCCCLIQMARPMSRRELHGSVQ